MKIDPINIFLLSVTAALGILVFIYPPVLEFSWILFLFTIILLGIPHGALDHVLYLKKNGSKKPWRFYLFYIGLIAATGLFWWNFPTIAFILFLIISAYHFGQSQLYQINGPKWLKNLLFLSWGSFLLSIIIYTNLDECIRIFSSLEWLNLSLLNSGMYWSAVMTASFFVLFAGAAYAAFQRFISFNNLLFEAGTLVLLCFLAVYSNAVFSFTIYFGIWHSFRSLVIEYEYVADRQRKSRFIPFLKRIFPFTILATAFLAAALFLMPQQMTGISPYMIFIIVISMLTVPHLIVMHDLYEKFS
ncbi:Brp/Blh family beta-carotene 15,15'-dioxygenase [Fulvivirga sedimenti]|uniref:Probable beta-carotene 15,15'-dioxygenase n=1 Tax=Fulvivirga sedimenti TaxID=2879465 RepID=A0A9X1HRM4_9BACT|nr:Brp/Blh family beta-carotene 15,15'-dioxygenase [Fulvivirga sedimenti]MCA6075578.1 Brp/Blh family beta-carotene 15,15'-dioxygenase [Fulvivirga sedimenti]MCA6076755.1 Brp/Blh family beta-carotene 15,15'-dioxygenase [Fulvivirga sedimenti]MCA6077883.1 Brp/Blh family beta-carotene 15,15'-dioxygenase [Fulvivirga sedimenti]